MAQWFLELDRWEGWGYITVGSVVVGMILAAYFIARFLWTSGKDAWKNPFGRYLLARKATITALFLVVLSNRIFGEWVGRNIATSLLMAWFAIQTYWPTKLLVESQREHEQEKERLESEREYN